MTLYFIGHLVKWEDLIKQLDEAEIEAYSHVRFMAQELEEPQEIIVEGITIGLLWPSGAFQSARRTNEFDSLEMN